MTLFLCMAEKKTLSSALVAPAHLPPLTLLCFTTPVHSTSPLSRSHCLGVGCARRRRGGEVGQLKQQISEHGNVAHQMKPIHAGILV